MGKKSTDQIKAMAHQKLGKQLCGNAPQLGGSTPAGSLARCALAGTAALPPRLPQVSRIWGSRFLRQSPGSTQPPVSQRCPCAFKGGSESKTPFSVCMRQSRVLSPHSFLSSSLLSFPPSFHPFFLLLPRNSYQETKKKQNKTKQK